MVLYAMAAESALFAFLLLAIACLQSNVLSIVGVIEPCQLPGAEVARDAFGRMVRYFGAGIYEELLFRLLLVPATMAAIGLAFASRRVKIAGALLLTSLIFSAAHYVGPHGDAFAWHSFSFRFLAGALFAGLFVYRGFGIAAGTHALYDVLVGFPSP
jgi:membrane protease YdiL (CAAX protease family)